MRSRDELTERQAEVLAYIRAYIQRYRRSPTVREIMSGAGVSSESEVIRFLKRLEEAGHIRRQERTSRGISLTDDPAVRADDYRAVIEEAAADLDNLAEWVQEGPLDPLLIATVITARAEGLRAALQTVGASV